MKKIYWTQKNGEKIDVDKMDVDHLRNTLKMIIRQTNFYNPDNMLEEIQWGEKQAIKFEREENIWKHGGQD